MGVQCTNNSNVFSPQPTTSLLPSTLFTFTSLLSVVFFFFHNITSATLIILMKKREAFYLGLIYIHEHVPTMQRIKYKRTFDF